MYQSYQTKPDTFRDIFSVLGIKVISNAIMLLVPSQDGLATSWIVSDLLSGKTMGYNGKKTHRPNRFLTRQKEARKKGEWYIVI